MQSHIPFHLSANASWFYHNAIKGSVVPYKCHFNNPCSQRVNVFGEMLMFLMMLELDCTEMISDVSLRLVVDKH